MQLLLVCITVFLCGAGLALPHNPFLFKFKRPVQSIKGLNGLGISGGTSASIGSVPYQAAIITSDGYTIGSGAIVGKKFILTSAYLVYSFTGLKVRVGSADSSKGGQLIDVQEAIVHDSFDYFYSYDVALLKLSKSIKYSKTAKPVQLASKEPKKGTSAVVSGFGTTSLSSTQNDNSGDLRKGNQKAVERTNCQSYYSGITLDESDSCAFSSSACPCYYDLGDPLVHKNTLIGYFIGGSYCCENSNPQIYTNVANINEWVKNHMKAAGYDENENYGHYYSDQ